MNFMLSIFFALSFLNAHAQSTTIHVMGDSLAYGTGAPYFALSPTNCLKKGFPQADVLNEAEPGMQSDKFLRNIIQWQPLGTSKLVFVSMGGNDVMMNILKPGVFPDYKSYANMDQSFDYLLQQGVKVVYLGLAPPREGSERLPEVSRIAEQKGITVVDGMNGLWGNPLYMADMVHPNSEGYAIMCDKILHALKEYVP